MLSTTAREYAEAFNAMIRHSSYDYSVPSALPRHFGAPGLTDVPVTPCVVTAHPLDEHPFWRGFLVEQLPMFVHAGLLDDGVARALADDLEALNSQGVFSAAFMVGTAVGAKP